MQDASIIGSFSVFVMLIFLVPGPVAVYILTCGMERGRWAGLVAVLGVQTAHLMLMLAVIGGVRTVVPSSPLMFDFLRYTGALCLMTIGANVIRTRTRGVDLVPARTSGAMYGQSVLVTLLNPQTALMHSALLPAFVYPARGGLTAQFAVLALVFVLLGLVVEGGYALVGGAIGDRMRADQRISSATRWVTGGIYVAMGLGIAVHTVV